MSFFLGSMLGIAGILFAILLWKSLPADNVGRPPRVRRQETGFQGRLTEWLYWDAPLSAPRTKDLDAPATERLARVGDRALFAALSRVQSERQVSLEEAHRLIKKHAKSPAARAFLDGRMRRATRLHWRSRYGGPPSLFVVWYYLIAVVRYGRRHLYLETLSAVLQELRR
jgi:hypothetical protein